MAITPAQLAAALRADATNQVVLTEMARLISTARSLINSRIPGLTASTNATEIALVDQAVTQIAGYLYDSPSGVATPTIWRSSGAAALLAPYRTHRAVPGDADGTPEAGFGSALTGQDIANLLDAFLGYSDWRTGGTVANVPAATDSVRGAVFGITDAIVDAETNTGWFAWKISNVRRLIERIVPSWARGTGQIPASRIAVGNPDSEKVPTTSQVGGQTVIEWRRPAGSHFWYGNNEPDATLHSIFTHYLRTSNPAEWWIRQGNPIAWAKIYTWPVGTTVTPSSVLAALLESEFGTRGSGRVLTLDGQGDNPSWQPPQGGTTIQQVQTLIANHAGDEDAHQPREEPWARQGDTSRIPASKSGADGSGDSEYILRRIGTDTGASWLGLNGFMQKAAVIERVQDIVGSMWSNVGAVSYDDPTGKFNLTLPSAATSGNAWVLKFFRPGSDPSKIIAERVGQINANGKFTEWTGIVNYVGEGPDHDWTIAVANAADFNDHFSGDLRFGGGGTSDYDNLTDKPVTRVSGLSAIPLPSADTNGHRYQTNNGELYRVEDIYVAGEDRVVTLAAFPTDTTSTSGVRFQGAVDHFSDLPQTIVTADEGKWWFIRSTINNGESPFIEIDNNARHKSTAHSPDGTHPYVAAFDTEAAAKASHEVTAAGQLVIHPDANGVYQVYEVQSGFVAGTPGHHTYGLVRQDVSSHLLARLAALEAGSGVQTTTETVKTIRYGTTFEVTTLEANATYSGAHGLGREPDGWVGYIECVTADKSYAVGDKVQWKPPPWRETVRFDATNTYVYTKNQGWGIIDKGSTSGTSTNIDLLDWKLVIKPYIFEDKEVVTAVTAMVGGGGGLSEADATALIAPWARANSPSGTIPDNRIPASIARDSEIPTNAEIDGRIHSAARANSPSGQLPPARLGTGARDGSKFLRDDGAWETPAGGGAGGSLPVPTAAITAKTASYTFVAGDIGTFVSARAVANGSDKSFTLTVPLDLGADGDRIFVYCTARIQGATDVQASIRIGRASGVTLGGMTWDGGISNSYGSFEIIKLEGNGDDGDVDDLEAVTLVKTGTNAWFMYRGLHP